MTAMPLPAEPQWPLTVASYTALPEDTDLRFELQEGMLVMSPSPFAGHQRAQLRVAVQLEPQVPGGLVLVPDVDVDLQLVPPTAPGTVRRPDLVVVTAEEFERARRERTLLRASDTVLAVEIHSPGAVRRDTVIKYGEYADAGIGHYWMIDLDAGPALTASHLGGEFGYVDDAPVTGVVAADLPFPVRLDLDALG